MAENSNPGNKAQMPEHIRKMFEQKGMLKKQEQPEVQKPTQAPQQETQPADQQTEVVQEFEQQIVEQESQEVVETQQVEEEQVEPVAEEGQEVETFEQPQTSEPKPKKQKEKKEKVKKEKAPKDKKDKKSLSKKKKTLILIGTIGGVILAAAIAIAVVVLININKKMETPELSVYETSSGIILFVEPNERAVSYEFTIKKTGNSKAIVIPSETNELNPLKAAMETPGTYTISARYIGVNDNATSNSSKNVVYNKYEQLKTPVVTKKQNTLEWVQITNASGYRVYYGVENNVPKYLEVPATTSANAVFNLSEIDKLGAGAYTLYVVAVGDGNYSASELSAPIEYGYSSPLAAPKNIVYDGLNKILSFTIDVEKSKTTSFMIYINGEKIKFRYDAEKTQGAYELNLAPLLSGVTVNKIGVVCVGDGTYTTNSAVKEIDMS